MNHRVELVYFQGCPHVDSARSTLRAALILRGLKAEWQEWDSGAPETPESYQDHGSPTILIDGEDVTGGGAGEGPRCIATGAPSLDQILVALDRARGVDAGSRGR